MKDYLIANLAATVFIIEQDHAGLTETNFGTKYLKHMQQSMLRSKHDQEKNLNIFVPLLLDKLCRYQFDRLPFPPPPPADPRATYFFCQNPRPQDSFSVQNSGSWVEKTKQKSPPPGITCPSSNAKRSMKKEHNSIKAVSFQIFHNLSI